MKESRVDKFASYREEIKRLDEETVDVKDEKEKVPSLEDTQTQLSFDDMIKKHDEYTIMFDSAQMAEKKALEERKKRNEKVRLIKNIILYSALGVASLIIIFLIVLILGGF